MNREQNIDLLKQPLNTPMYFVKLDRAGYAFSIEKVLYLGYSEGSRVDSYEEPGIVRYFEYEQPLFHIRFKTEKGREFIIEVDNIPYWTGLRAFDTDEHYACGKAKFPFVDYYFTTSKHKLLAFLEKEKYIDKLRERKKDLDRSLDFIDSIMRNDN